MEDVVRRSHPSVPANYVSFLDLRERWMKQQQLKKQAEEIEQKELQDNSVLQVDQEQVKEEVENKDNGDDSLLEERHPDEILVVQPNPNPNTANRRPFNKKPWHQWHGEEGNKRWVPLKEAPVSNVIRPQQAPVGTSIRPNQASVVTVTPPRQAPSISSSEPEPVNLVMQNALPLHLTDQSKAPLLEIPKVEAVVQAPVRIRGSDENITGQRFNSVRMWKAKVRNQKTNLKRDLLESQPNRGVPVPDTNRNLEEKAKDKVLEEPMSLLAVHAHVLKSRPSEAVKVDSAIHITGEIEASDEEDKDRNLNNGKTKRKNFRSRKSNQKHNLVKSHPNNSVLNPKAHLNEKDDARVQLEPKAFPDLHSEQSKPPSLDASRVNLTVQPEIQSSDEVVTDLKLDRVTKKKKPLYKQWKRNQKVESVTQPHLKKENLVPDVVEEKEAPKQEVGADNNAVYDNGTAKTEVVTDLKSDSMMMKKKPYKNYPKRNQKVESVTQAHLKKENLAPNAVDEKEIPEQEVGADSNAVCDNLGDETEGKFAGLSVTRAPEPAQRYNRGSFVARNRNGWSNGSSYGKFERTFMMKKERAWGEGSFVWVKKGESSQTGDVTVENLGNIRM